MAFQDTMDLSAASQSVAAIVKALVQRVTIATNSIEIECAALALGQQPGSKRRVLKRRPCSSPHLSG